MPSSSLMVVTELSAFTWPPLRSSLPATLYVESLLPSNTTVPATVRLLRLTCWAFTLLLMPRFSVEPDSTLASVMMACPCSFWTKLPLTPTSVFVELPSKVSLTAVSVFVLPTVNPPAVLLELSVMSLVVSSFLELSVTATLLSGSGTSVTGAPPVSMVVLLLLAIITAPPATTCVPLIYTSVAFSVSSLAPKKATVLPFKAVFAAPSWAVVYDSVRVK